MQIPDSEKAPFATHHNQEFWKGLARAFAGAAIFSLPLLMTMEMWWLGFYMEPYRLILFICINVFLLIGLERYWGFKRNDNWQDTVIDAFVGYAVGFITAFVFLPLFGVLSTETALSEVIGKVTLQAVPASIGAILARSQLGQNHERSRKVELSPQRHYFYQLLLMLAGALFVSLNIAPTEEMVLIAYKITPWHGLLLLLLSIIIIHVFVYRLEFKGQEKRPEHTDFWRVFFCFSLAGYALVLLISLYLLWSFGRLDGSSLHAIAHSVIVLAVPGAIGAAAARLII
jgi:putative integral membrane protein (TIGR02587 family)